jgi:succinyl-diaminopimelate desuccinylase
MITENNLEAILRSLIEIDTSNPPGRNYRRICEVIKELLEPTGCDISLLRTPSERVKKLIEQGEEISGERINLIAKIKRGEGKTLILNGHIDVVPATGNWKHPPFELISEDDYWYGRGVADMKGSLAGLIKVVQDLSSNDNWKGTVVLEAVCDEEIGGYTGTAYLHDTGFVKGDYCIVGDGYANNITNAANGCLRFKVTVRGKSVHSKMNWRGINAVEKSSHLIGQLEGYNKVLNQRRSKVPANPKTGVDFVTPSISIGTIRGGTKVNIIPDECFLEIDRRVGPQENKDAAIMEFQRILDDLKTNDKDFNYDLHIGGFHDSFEIPEDVEPIPTLKEAYRQVKGVSCPVYGGLGCYDAAHVAKHGIPVAVLGTSRVESNVHGIDERVRIRDVLDFTKTIETTSIKLLR